MLGLGCDRVIWTAQELLAADNCEGLLATTKGWGAGRKMAPPYTLNLRCPCLPVGRCRPPTLRLLPEIRGNEINCWHANREAEKKIGGFLAEKTERYLFGFGPQGAVLVTLGTFWTASIGFFGLFGLFRPLATDGQECSHLPFLLCPGGQDGDGT